MMFTESATKGSSHESNPTGTRHKFCKSDGMTEERYKPVSCDYHDELEEAAMHQKRIELEFELEGVTQRETGRIADVFTSGGAEFVKFESGQGGAVDIRLDHIISMRPA
jgi:Rho-binding antiterminator